MNTKDLAKVMDQLTSERMLQRQESHRLSGDKSSCKKTLQDMIGREQLLFEKSVYVVLPDETPGNYVVTKYVLTRPYMRELLDSDM